jgi:hypothetical protein
MGKKGRRKKGKGTMKESNIIPFPGTMAIGAGCA